MFDILIRNGRLVDGTGAPWRRADLAIQDGRIVAVGRLAGEEAAHVIEANGLTVTPGFIDAHVHSDVLLLADPEVAAASLHQGVTTHVVGQDGISFAPAGPQTMDFYRDYLAGLNGNPADLGFRWRTVAEFLARFDEATPVNVAYLVPHGNVRMEAMGGCFDRPPTDAESRLMQALVAQGMAEGAVGVSTGLIYLPCLYANTDELIAIARPAAEAGGVFVTHMRTYAPGRVATALDETFQVARAAQVPVHISHFNGRADELLPLIDHARTEGIEVTFDTYPYLAGASLLMTLLPDWVSAGGFGPARARLRDPAVRAQLIPFLESPERGWERLRLNVLSRPEHRRWEGLSPIEAAAEAGLPLSEFLLDLLLAEDLQVGMMQFHDWRTEEDMQRIMAHPAHMAGSDGIYVGGRPHPRGWGAFARYIERYVRALGVLSLEEMVRHMTSAAAWRFGLHDRGVLRPGAAADVVVLDLSTVHARATFEDGRQRAEGVQHVVVNGRWALRDGRLTGDTPGRGLRHQYSLPEGFLTKHARK
jgi:N-acyl-D-amino-acid deacylase